jgi:transposase-like protein
METTTSLVQASEPVLLKTDVLGRVKRTREQRERILDEFERSGVSGCKFAALVGVKYQTFATWLQQRKRQPRASPKSKRAAKTPAQLKWFEAVAQNTAAPQSCANAESLLVQLPGGARAELTSSHQVALLAALVRALGKLC